MESSPTLMFHVLWLTGTQHVVRYTIMTLNNIILRSVFFAAFGLLVSLSGELAFAQVNTPPIWQNPHLAENNFSGVHFNAYQTDTRR